MATKKEENRSETPADSSIYWNDFINDQPKHQMVENKTVYQKSRQFYRRNDKQECPDDSYKDDSMSNEKTSSYQMGNQNDMIYRGRRYSFNDAFNRNIEIIARNQGVFSDEGTSNSQYDGRHKYSSVCKGSQNKRDFQNKLMSKDKNHDRRDFENSSMHAENFYNDNYFCNQSKSQNQYFQGYQSMHSENFYSEKYFRNQSQHFQGYQSMYSENFDNDKYFHDQSKTQNQHFREYQSMYYQPSCFQYQHFQGNQSIDAGNFSNDKYSRKQSNSQNQHFQRNQSMYTGNFYNDQYFRKQSNSQNQHFQRNQSMYTGNFYNDQYFHKQSNSHNQHFQGNQSIDAGNFYDDKYFRKPSNSHSQHFQGNQSMDAGNFYDDKYFRKQSNYQNQHFQGNQSMDAGNFYNDKYSRKQSNSQNQHFQRNQSIDAGNFYNDKYSRKQSNSQNQHFQRNQSRDAGNFYNDKYSRKQSKSQNQHFKRNQSIYGRKSYNGKNFQKHSYPQNQNIQRNQHHYNGCNNNFNRAWEYQNNFSDYSDFDSDQPNEQQNELDSSQSQKSYNWEKQDTNVNQDSNIDQNCDTVISVTESIASDSSIFPNPATLNKDEMLKLPRQYIKLPSQLPKFEPFRNLGLLTAIIEQECNGYEKLQKLFKVQCTTADKPPQFDDDFKFDGEVAVPGSDYLSQPRLFDENNIIDLTAHLDCDDQNNSNFNEKYAISGDDDKIDRTLMNMNNIVDNKGLTGTQKGNERNFNEDNSINGMDCMLQTSTNFVSVNQNDSNLDPKHTIDGDGDKNHRSLMNMNIIADSTESIAARKEIFRKAYKDHFIYGETYISQPSFFGENNNAKRKPNFNWGNQNDSNLDPKHTIGGDGDKSHSSLINRNNIVDNKESTDTQRRSERNLYEDHSISVSVNQNDSNLDSKHAIGGDGDTIHTRLMNMNITENYKGSSVTWNQASLVVRENFSINSIHEIEHNKIKWFDVETEIDRDAK